ncbi:hypothetical protein COB52_05670 [Candidatus Kaiserbacteria bacterium]|nr:MAG: hypothetical protein COB52_05670 [Candidatus Kaiserbacteria bacterium]
MTTKEHSFVDFDLVKTSRTWEKELGQPLFDDLGKRKILIDFRLRRNEGFTFFDDLGEGIIEYELTFINNSPHLLPVDFSSPAKPIQKNGPIVLQTISLRSYIAELQSNNAFSPMKLNFELPQDVFYIGSKRFGPTWVHWLGTLCDRQKRFSEFDNFFRTKANSSSRFVLSTTGKSSLLTISPFDPNYVSLSEFPWSQNFFKLSKGAYIKSSFGLDIDDVIENSNPNSLIVSYQEGAIYFCGKKVIRRRTNTFDFVRCLAENAGKEFEIDHFVTDVMKLNQNGSSPFVGKQKDIFRNKIKEVFGKDSHPIELLEKVIPNRVPGKYGTIQLVVDDIEIILFQ